MHRQLAANSHEHDDLLLSHVIRLMTVTAGMHQRLHFVLTPILNIVKSQCSCKQTSHVGDAMVNETKSYTCTTYY